MKHSYKNFILYSAFLGLSACGGGSDTQVSISTPLALSIPEKPHFERILSAFDDPTSLYDFAYKDKEVANRGMIAYAVDLDDDGKDELVLVLTVQPIDTSIRSSSKIYIFQLDKNYKFIDVTNNFVNGSTVFEGLISTATIIRLNNFPAILFGDNEDRPPFWSGQLRVMHKLSSKFEITSLSELGRGDVPDAFIDKNGFVNLASATWGNPATPNIYNNGLLTKSNMSMPPLSVGGFKLLSNGNSYANQLIQTGIHDLFTIEGYTQNNNGQWESVGVYQPFSKVTTEPWYSGGTVDVLSYNGSYLLGNRTGAAIGTICKVKYGSSGAYAALSHIPILTIKKYVPGQVLDWAAIESPSAKLAISTIENGKLNVRFPLIIGYLPKISYRNYVCKDINGDGLDDIIVNPVVTYPDYNQDASPVVYLAKTDGTFAKANFTALTYQIVRPSHAHQASSLLGDFDGDKLQDIIMFGHTVGYGNLPSQDKTLQFYKANKKIE